VACAKGSREKWKVKKAKGRRLLCLRFNLSSVICHNAQRLGHRLLAIGYWLFEAVIASRPVAVMVLVAAGEDRKVIKDFAALVFLDPVTIPAEKMVIFCTSSGKGPTSSIPGIDKRTAIRTWSRGEMHS
jgi:hypothetical protein